MCACGYSVKAQPPFLSNAKTNYRTLKVHNPVSLLELCMLAILKYYQRFNHIQLPDELTQHLTVSNIFTISSN